MSFLPHDKIVMKIRFKYLKLKQHSINHQLNHKCANIMFTYNQNCRSLTAAFWTNFPCQRTCNDLFAKASKQIMRERVPPLQNSNKTSTQRWRRSRQLSVPLCSVVAEWKSLAQSFSSRFCKKFINSFRRQWACWQAAYGKKWERTLSSWLFERLCFR